MEPQTGNSPLTRSITETRDLSILARQSVISFRFAALSYQSPAKNRHEFHLEGFDKGWRRAGPERHANYTNLDPGNYRFRVRASNSDGIWNEDGISLAIVVVPPFWRTWWGDEDAQKDRFRSCNGLRRERSD